MGVAGSDDCGGCRGYGSAVARCAAGRDIDVPRAALPHPVFSQHVVLLCGLVRDMPGILYAIVRALWANTES